MHDNGLGPVQPIPETRSRSLIPCLNGARPFVDLLCSPDALKSATGALSIIDVV